MKKNEDSVTLFLSHIDPCPKHELFVEVTLYILNGKRQPTNIMEFEENNFGDPMTRRVKYPSFMTRSELMELVDLLPDDKLTIGCDLTIHTITEALFDDQTCELYLKGHYKLFEDFQSLLADNVMSDVTLVVDGQEFHAHKIILSARSAVFSAMFQSQMKESVENKVKIGDIKGDTFKIVLEYIYTAEIPNLTDIETLQDVLYAANKYYLDHLKTVCEVKLFNRICLETAAQILTVADLNNVIYLKERTTRYIIDHLKEVVKTEEWKLLKESQPRLVMEILDEIAARY